MIKRLADRSRQVRHEAHSWLKRETRQKIAMSFTLWRDWLKRSKGLQLQEAVAAIATENGFESVEEFLSDGGYQFLGDYLADGGREKVQEYLDAQVRKSVPAVQQEGGRDPNDR